MINCKKCGSENRPENVFCYNCGSKLNKQNVSNQKNNSTKRSKKKNGVISVLFVISIIITALVSYFATRYYYREFTPQITILDDAVPDFSSTYDYRYKYEYLNSDSNFRIINEDCAIYKDTSIMACSSYYAKLEFHDLENSERLCFKDSSDDYSNSELISTPIGVRTGMSVEEVVKTIKNDYKVGVTTDDGVYRSLSQIKDYSTIDEIEVLGYKFGRRLIAHDTYVLAFNDDNILEYISI